MRSTIYTTILGLAILIFSLDSQAAIYNDLIFLESELEKNEFCNQNTCGEVFVFDYDYNYYNRTPLNEPVLYEPVQCLLLGCDLLSSTIETTPSKSFKPKIMGKLYVVNFRPVRNPAFGAEHTDIKGTASIYGIIDICYAGSVKCTKLSLSQEYMVTANFYLTPDPTPPPLKPGENPGEDDPE